ncbi:hypothetical protein [Halomonas denitrificans]|nr:hypothetical protein [Halomonas denitrificans]
MKKVLIGCLGVFVLVAVAGGIVTYVKVIKPGMEFVGGMAELGQEFQELNDSIENRESFAPPGDGTLDEARFQRFLAAQRQMRGELEGRLTELKTKYEELEAEIDERGGQAGIGDMVGAYADLADLLIAGKRAQVEALNTHRFSIEEYNYTRDRVYRALGEGVAVAAIAQSGNAGQFTQTVPQETIDMVEPHREELMESYVLAWWGL